MEQPNPNKFMRTARIRTEQTPGALGQLLISIENAGGDLGNSPDSGYSSSDHSGWRNLCRP
jgi:hypothetical protein